MFGATRVPVAISILVKNPESANRGVIEYHDIGDYLTRDQKLAKISDYKSVAGIETRNGWTRIVPDKHGDWIKQRSDAFSMFISLATVDGETNSVFGLSSWGIVTARDAWACNPSRLALEANMSKMITFYNAEVDRFSKAFGAHAKPDRDSRVKGFVCADKTKISWGHSLLSGVASGRRVPWNEKCVVKIVYRPFTRQWAYMDNFYNHSFFKIPFIFPPDGGENLAIAISQNWRGEGQLGLLIDSVPEYSLVKMSLCFPLNIIEKQCRVTNEDSDCEPNWTRRSFSDHSQLVRRDGITDTSHKYFQSLYPTNSLTKEDIFYYIYGMLHSADYKRRYADNLVKDRPRVPRVRTAKDFWAFSKAGRTLGHLHVNFEKVPEFDGASVEGPSEPKPTHYRVEKMKYGKQQDKKKDKTVIHYNTYFTIRKIPLEAYDYVINGRPAIEWVMKYQSVTTDKASGITKNANEYAIETMNDPRYPLSLLLRVITVSLETMSIVNTLPALDIIESDPWIVNA